MIYERLRPRTGWRERSHVTHLFDEDRHWFPLREAACGREYPAETLDGDVTTSRLCAGCRKAVAAQEVAA